MVNARTRNQWKARLESTEAHTSSAIDGKGEAHVPPAQVPSVAVLKSEKSRSRKRKLDSDPELDSAAPAIVAIQKDIEDRTRGKHIVQNGSSGAGLRAERGSGTMGSSDPRAPAHQRARRRGLYGAIGKTGDVQVDARADGNISSDSTVKEAVDFSEENQDKLKILDDKDRKQSKEKVGDAVNSHGRELNPDRKRRNLLHGLGSVSEEIVNLARPLTRGMAKPSSDGPTGTFSSKKRKRLRPEEKAAAPLSVERESTGAEAPALPKEGAAERPSIELPIDGSNVESSIKTAELNTKALAGVESPADVSCSNLVLLQTGTQLSKHGMPKKSAKSMSEVRSVKQSRDTQPRPLSTRVTRQMKGTDSETAGILKGSPTSKVDGKSSSSNDEPDDKLLEPMTVVEAASMQLRNHKKVVENLKSSERPPKRVKKKPDKPSELISKSRAAIGIEELGVNDTATFDVQVNQIAGSENFSLDNGDGAHLCLPEGALTNGSKMNGQSGIERQVDPGLQPAVSGLTVQCIEGRLNKNNGKESSDTKECTEGDGRKGGRLGRMKKREKKKIDPGGCNSLQENKACDLDIMPDNGKAQECTVIEECSNVGHGPCNESQPVSDKQGIDGQNRGMTLGLGGKSQKPLELAEIRVETGVEKSAHLAVTDGGCEDIDHHHPAPKTLLDGSSTGGEKKLDTLAPRGGLSKLVGVLTRGSGGHGRKSRAANGRVKKILKTKGNVGKWKTNKKAADFRVLIENPENLPENSPVDSALEKAVDERKCAFEDEQTHQNGQAEESSQVEYGPPSDVQAGLGEERVDLVGIDSERLEVAGMLKDPSELLDVRFGDTIGVRKAVEVTETGGGDKQLDHHDLPDDGNGVKHSKPVIPRKFPVRTTGVLTRGRKVEFESGIDPGIESGLEPRLSGHSDQPRKYGRRKKSVAGKDIGAEVESVALVEAKTHIEMSNFRGAIVADNGGLSTSPGCQAESRGVKSILDTETDNGESLEAARAMGIHKELGSEEEGRTDSPVKLAEEEGGSKDNDHRQALEEGSVEIHDLRMGKKLIETNRGENVSKRIRRKGPVWDRDKDVSAQSLLRSCMGLINLDMEPVTADIGTTVIMSEKSELRKQVPGCDGDGERREIGNPETVASVCVTAQILEPEKKASADGRGMHKEVKKAVATDSQPSCENGTGLPSGDGSVTEDSYQGALCKGDDEGQEELSKGLPVPKRRKTGRSHVATAISMVTKGNSKVVPELGQCVKVTESPLCKGVESDVVNNVVRQNQMDVIRQPSPLDGVLKVTPEALQIGLRTGNRNGPDQGQLCTCDPEGERKHRKELSAPKDCSKCLSNAARFTTVTREDSKFKETVEKVNRTDSVDGHEVTADIIQSQHGEGRAEQSNVAVKVIQNPLQVNAEVALQSMEDQSGLGSVLVPVKKKVWRKRNYGCGIEFQRITRARDSTRKCVPNTESQGSKIGALADAAKGEHFGIRAEGVLSTTDASKDSSCLEQTDPGKCSVHVSDLLEKSASAFPIDDTVGTTSLQGEEVNETEGQKLLVSDSNVRIFAEQEPDNREDPSSAPSSMFKLVEESETAAQLELNGGPQGQQASSTVILPYIQQKYLNDADSSPKVPDSPNGPFASEDGDGGLNLGVSHSLCLETICSHDFRPLGALGACSVSMLDKSEPITVVKTSHPVAIVDTSGPVATRVESDGVSTMAESSPVAIVDISGPVATIIESDCSCTIADSFPVASSVESDPVPTSVESDSVAVVADSSCVGTTVEPSSDAINVESNRVGNMAEAFSVGTVDKTGPVATIIESDGVGVIVDSSPVATPVELDPVPTSVEFDPVAVVVDSGCVGTVIESLPVDTSVKSEPIPMSNAFDSVAVGTDSGCVGTMVEAFPVDSSVKSEPASTSNAFDPVAVVPDSGCVGTSVESFPVATSVESDSVPTSVTFGPVAVVAESGCVATVVEPFPVDIAVESDPVAPFVESDPVSAVVEPDPIASVAASDPFATRVESDLVASTIVSDPVPFTVESGLLRRMVDSDPGATAVRSDPLPAVAGVHPITSSYSSYVDIQNSICPENMFDAFPAISKPESHRVVAVAVSATDSDSITTLVTTKSNAVDVAAVESSPVDTDVGNEENSQRHLRLTCLACEISSGREIAGGSERTMGECLTTDAVNSQLEQVTLGAPLKDSEFSEENSTKSPLLGREGCQLTLRGKVADSIQQGHPTSAEDVVGQKPSKLEDSLSEFCASSETRTQERESVTEPELDTSLQRGACVKLVSTGRPQLGLIDQACRKESSDVVEQERFATNSTTQEGSVLQLPEHSPSNEMAKRGVDVSRNVKSRQLPAGTGQVVSSLDVEPIEMDSNEGSITSPTSISSLCNVPGDEPLEKVVSAVKDLEQTELEDQESRESILKNVDNEIEDRSGLDDDTENENSESREVHVKAYGIRTELSEVHSITGKVLTDAVREQSEAKHRPDLDAKGANLAAQAVQTEVYEEQIEAHLPGGAERLHHLSLRGDVVSANVNAEGKQMETEAAKIPVGAKVDGADGSDHLSLRGDVESINVNSESKQMATEVKEIHVGAKAGRAEGLDHLSSGGDGESVHVNSESNQMETEVKEIHVGGKGGGAEGLDHLSSRGDVESVNVNTGSKHMETEAKEIQAGADDRRRELDWRIEVSEVDEQLVVDPDASDSVADEITNKNEHITERVLALGDLDTLSSDQPLLSNNLVPGCDGSVPATGPAISVPEPDIARSVTSNSTLDQRTLPIDELTKSDTENDVQVDEAHTRSNVQETAHLVQLTSPLRAIRCLDDDIPKGLSDVQPETQEKEHSKPTSRLEEPLQLNQLDTVQVTSPLEASRCVEGDVLHPEEVSDIQMETHEKDDSKNQASRLEDPVSQRNMAGVKGSLVSKKRKVRSGIDTPREPESVVRAEDAPCRVYSKRKGFLLTSTTIESGGMRIRPRPLDPDQSIPILIEGRDKDFHDYDGGSFYRWVQQQEEAKLKKPSLHPVADGVNGSGGISSVARTDLVKKRPIFVPLFRKLPDVKRTSAKIVTRPEPDAMNGMESAFPRPHGYLQHTKPATRNLGHALGGSFCTVPSVYDMDDEDEEWLQAYNEILKHCGPDQLLSEDTFEQLMELFEREFYRICQITDKSLPVLPRILGEKSGPSGRRGKRLVLDSNQRHCRLEVSKDRATVFKSMEMSQGALPQKETERKFALENRSDDCCICNGGENSDSNPVRRCQICSINVHESCYGICATMSNEFGHRSGTPNWRCKKCEAVVGGTALHSISCAICCKSGGAMKPTVDPLKWAHVACALYTNETFFIDTEAMEPVDGLAAVESRVKRQRERCGLCGAREGSCVRCSTRGCRTPFHISCGVSQGASFELRHTKQQVEGIRSFCPHHATSVPGANMDEIHQAPSKIDDAGEPLPAVSTESSDSLEIRHVERGSMGDEGTAAEDTIMNGVGWQSSFSNKTKLDRPDCKRYFRKFRRRTGTGGATPSKIDPNSSPYEVSEKDVHGVSRTLPRSGPLLKENMQSVSHYMDESDPYVHPSDAERLESEAVSAATSASSSHLTNFENMDHAGNATSNVDEVDPVILSAKVKSVTQDAYVSDAVFLKFPSLDTLDTNLAPTPIVKAVYSFWQVKRVKAKGPILHELRQLQVARSQGIFNKVVLRGTDFLPPVVNDSPARIPITRRPRSLSRDPVFSKFSDLRQQLEILRSIASNVVRREQMKLEDQKLVYESVQQELLIAREAPRRRRCLWCQSTQSLLNCSSCPKAFCFLCFKHRRGYGVKGWIAASKLPKYVCNFCLGSIVQERGWPELSANFSEPRGIAASRLAQVSGRPGDWNHGLEVRSKSNLGKQVSFLNETCNPYGSRSTLEAGSTMAPGRGKMIYTGRPIDLHAVHSKFAVPLANDGNVAVDTAYHAAVASSGPNDPAENESREQLDHMKVEGKKVKRRKSKVVNKQAEPTTVLRTTKRIKKLARSSSFVYGSEDETTVSENGESPTDKRTLKLSDLRDKDEETQCTNLLEVAAGEKANKGHPSLKFGIKFSPTGKLIVRRHGPPQLP